jgi:N utilization substance protein B
MQKYNEHKDEIKKQISECAIGWDIKRFIKIDRDILNIAVTELLYIKDVPIKVVIDEAVEIAKKYSTEDSSSFINGILGQIVKINNLKIKG